MNNIEQVWKKPTRLLRNVLSNITCAINFNNAGLIIIASTTRWLTTVVWTAKMCFVFALNSWSFQIDSSLWQIWKAKENKFICSIKTYIMLPLRSFTQFLSINESTQLLEKPLQWLSVLLQGRSSHSNWWVLMEKPFNVFYS